jgi:hypothetical protein
MSIPNPRFVRISSPNLDDHGHTWADLKARSGQRLADQHGSLDWLADQTVLDRCPDLGRLVGCEQLPSGSVSATGGTVDRVWAVDVQVLSSACTKPRLRRRTSTTRSRPAGGDRVIESWIGLSRRSTNMAAEPRMTAKSDFTSEEWESVLEGPPAVALMIALGWIPSLGITAPRPR